MSRATDRIVVGGYSIGWSAVRHLPERAAYRLFDVLADTAWRRQGKGVRRLEHNLDRALGGGLAESELRDLSRAGMRSYFRYWCDAFRLPGWSRERIVTRFHGVGDEVLVRGLAAGNGVVVSLPHMGNWDHAGAWACLAHAPLTTVAERLEPESLFQRFVSFREALGMEVLPLTGGDAPVFRTLADRLRSGRLVCLLGDRDLTERGVPVELFGATTKVPAGPAALAVDTGAMLVSATLWYDGPDAYAGLTEIPVPTAGSREERIQVASQRVADRFAEGIRAHPADWHMLQRLWLDDLDPARAPGGD